MTTLRIEGGTAIFTGFLPESIGAASKTEIDAVSIQVAALNTQLLDLSSASDSLQKLDYDSGANQLSINCQTEVAGKLMAVSSLAVKSSRLSSSLTASAETGKTSAWLDLQATNTWEEQEFSFFRKTVCSNPRAGIAVYVPNTENLNAYLAARNNSFVCALGGNFGIGTTSPEERLHVSGGWLRCSTGIKLGRYQNILSYAVAPPTSGTYRVGDILFNESPTAGGFVGWVCVASGSPGAWKTWGPISA